MGTPYLTLFSRDVRCPSWTQQLNVSGAAKAKVSDKRSREAVLTSLNDTISGITSSRQFLECGYTRFPGVPFDVGSSGVYQYYLNNVILRRVADVLAPPLAGLLPPVLWDNVYANPRERRLAILSATVLRVEFGPVGVHWLEPKASYHTVLFPVFPRSSDDIVLTIQVVSVTESENTTVVLGGKSKKVINLGKDSTPLAFHLKPSEFIVLKEGNVFSARNPQMEDMFVACLSISVINCDSGDPVLSPCRMALQEVFIVEELRTYLTIVHNLIGSLGM